MDVYGSVMFTKGWIFGFPGRAVYALIRTESMTLLAAWKVKLQLDSKSDIRDDVDAS